MKNIIRQILWNTGVVALAFYVFLYPEFSWYFKIFLYIITILTIIGYAAIYYDYKEEKLDRTERLFLKKRKSNIYRIIDHFFDIIFCVIFANLDYSAIFVLYLIQIILSCALYDLDYTIARRRNEKL
jgi:magnesium-transporting ATPase (P-type)